MSKTFRMGHLSPTSAGSAASRWRRMLKPAMFEPVRTDCNGDSKVNELPLLRVQHPERVGGLDVSVHLALVVQQLQPLRQVVEHVQDLGELARRAQPPATSA